MDDNRWPLPAAIGRVVGKLRFFLGNSSDSHKFKGTMKTLDLLEEKLKLLREENLERVSIDREEDISAWLRQVKEAADDAEELVKDMESELVLEAGESVISDAMSWFHSDTSFLLRMKYTVGRLVSVCTEGETIIGKLNMDEDSWKTVQKNITSLSLDRASVVGRDKEISMILEMVLDEACFKAATSLDSWESADNLQISQKGWIIDFLRNVDLSMQRKEDAEVATCQNKTGSRIEYMRVCNDDEMWNPAVIPIVGMSGVDNIRKEELMTQILISLQPQLDVSSSVRHLSIDMDSVNVSWGDYNIERLRSLMLFGGFRDIRKNESYSTIDNVLEWSYDTGDSISETSYDTVDSVLEISYDTIDSISELSSDIVDIDYGDFIMKRCCETIGIILTTSKSLRLFNLSKMRASAAESCIGDRLLDEDHIAMFVKFITRHQMLPLLTHLRYLDFSYSGITELPDSLCSLCNLQALTFREEGTFDYNTGQLFDGMDRKGRNIQRPGPLAAGLTIQSVICLPGSHADGSRLESGRQKKDVDSHASIVGARGTASIIRESPPKDEGIHVLQSLTELTMDNLSLSLNLENIIPKLSALRTLCLYKHHKISVVQEQLLEQFKLLQELEFSCCYFLRKLPSNLSSLSSLKKLSLQSCSRIHSLPSKGLPGNLRELQLSGCSPILQARCQKENGETWAKEKIGRWLKGGTVQHRQEKLNEFWQGWLKCEKEWAQYGSEQLKNHGEWLKNEQEEWLENSAQDIESNEDLCIKPTGEDWPKISHIPYVHLNGCVIQNLYF
ncbi:hypothetical protein PR202_ga00065 [Eleusine coracana subsp. coracana]|uniref:Rx N-terminal domain-containing protein n=1 Tax=Eleusine coracana subsp. coracana TaxID=191504 RepID=A0AAV5BDS7_ELECO|nr:hypothetical protein PR202_ga00065 [Eleusine coracana subsp. coracana]